MAKLFTTHNQQRPNAIFWIPKASLGRKIREWRSDLPCEPAGHGKSLASASHLVGIGLPGRERQKGDRLVQGTSQTLADSVSLSFFW